MMPQPSTVYGCFRAVGMNSLFVKSESENKLILSLCLLGFILHIARFFKMLVKGHLKLKKKKKKELIKHLYWQLRKVN